MKNLIIILILVLITVGIIGYLIREKKKGKVCAGCPCSGQCGGSCKKDGT